MSSALPVRLHRTMNRGNVTPIGAKYVGRPTDFANPFNHRPKIGHARGVILYDSWLNGQLTYHILQCAGFDDDEIAALARLRTRLFSRLHELVGFNLQCWCPLTSAWCHANPLIRFVNVTPELWRVDLAA